MACTDLHVKMYDMLDAILRLLIFLLERSIHLLSADILMKNFNGIQKQLIHLIFTV